VRQEAITVTASDLTTAFPSRHLPAVQVRDLPTPPRSVWRIVGPGVIAAGVGIASGEFILWPYIASQVGLVFLWAALVGLITQFFINMEIERYTLATGETALTGFSRFWRHWGLVFAVLVYFANLWPGWATSSASLLTYLFGGGEPRWIAIVMLLLIGAGLTLAPVVYTMLERVEFAKVGLVLLLIVGAVLFAISAEAWGELPSSVTAPAFPAEPLGFALILSAMAFAGAGGGQNLCQSNWIRDKRYGMGAHIPRLVSPVTGEGEIAAPSLGYIFPPNQENLTRWRRWWRFANQEQLATFVLITFISITFMSMLAYSTVFGREGLVDEIEFLQVEGEQLNSLVAPWFGGLFWVIGAVSLFAAAMGIVDYTSRLAADVLKTNYLRGSSWSESRIYFTLVWGLVVVGCLILLAGLDQPLVLLVISASVGGAMMAIYSPLLILLNRRVLPGPIRIKPARVAALAWATLLFAVLAAVTIWENGRELIDWFSRN
jgi:hypothetical protein